MSAAPRTAKRTFKILSSLQSGTEDVVHVELAIELETELTSTTARLAEAQKLLGWVFSNGAGREVFPTNPDGTPSLEFEVINQIPIHKAMSPENQIKYNIMVERINAMPVEEQDRLVNQDECPFEPEHMIGVPLGMFHCEVCGEMVLAGLPHPRKKDAP